MPQVPLKRTPVDAKSYAAAVASACRSLGWEPLSKASIGVLWAQYMIETGGKACWNYNLGNVKVTEAQVNAPGGGVQWIDLPGTWEVVNGRRVTLPEGHPGRRFRAFDSLADGMSQHLVFLRTRYDRCWPSVLASDPEGFAHALKAGRDGIEGTRDDYFTAPVGAYATGMRRHFNRWIASKAVDAGLASEAPTLTELPEEDEATETERMAIIHPRVPLRGDPPPDDDAA